MLRAIDGMVVLQRRFRLGVNLLGSVVNRHRIEAFLLDQHGRVVYTFERLRWDEKEVVDRRHRAARVQPRWSTPYPPRR